jgi:predicted secreted Zn-dependent protease
LPHLCGALAVLAAPALAEPNPVVPERVAPAAGVTVPTTFQPWTLTASTSREFRLEEVRGPCGRLACTEWSIDPTFSFEPAGRVCALTAVSVKVSVNYRLPRWEPARPVPAETLENWRNTQLPKILAHEGGHRDLAVETANIVHAALSALPPEPTCAGMVGRARGLALRLLGEGENRQRDYDARAVEELRHGPR